MSVIADQALDLPPAQRLRLIDKIWRSLSVDPDQIPVQETVLDELDSRRKKYKEKPSSLQDWADLKKTISQNRGETN